MQDDTTRPDTAATGPADEAGHSPDDGVPPPRDGLVALAAFDGWNDAGSAATSALAFVAEDWDTETLAVLDPEEYHDLQVNRPRVERGPDGSRILTFPRTEVLLATSPSTGERLVIVRGVEPSLRWSRYCAEILDALEAAGVRTLVSVGALLADVPHTRPIPVQSSSDDPAIQEALGLSSPDYEGPTGIVGVLGALSQERGLSAIGMWAAVPHYVSQPPSPKATLALLVALEDLVGMSLPTRDLAEDAAAWQRAVDELAQEDDDVAEYVEMLEESKDTAELPEASGEAIAREFERYLRRRDGGSPDKGSGPPPPTGR
ncbi:PAC2 family protein [Georgenia sp. Z1491]|uniref:PAC2 family protein n=1 Tax=Georgenia sp. Z1491 TaxID=3416707 RepID=UPI003CEFFA79